MKKIYLGLLIAAFTIGGECFARAELDTHRRSPDEKEAEKEKKLEKKEHAKLKKEEAKKPHLSKEERAAQKAAKKERKQQEREARKAAKKEKAPKLTKEEKQAQREARREEKKAEKERKKQEREARKAEKQKEREERKAAKKEKAHQPKMTKEERKAKQAEDKERRKAEREARKAEKQKEREERKAARKEKAHQPKMTKEERKAKQAEDKERRKAEREARKAEKEKKREERRKAREERKAIRKEERSSKEDREQRRAERRATRSAEKARKDEKQEKKHLDYLEKVERSNERTHKCKERRERKHDEAIAAENARLEQKYADVGAGRNERRQLMDGWNKEHRMASDRELGAGKYAYLYKSPTWPTSALFFEGKKDLLNVTFNYQYATDCYGPHGSGSKSSITKLAFGDQPITVKEILMASKLVSQSPPKLVQDDPIAPANSVSYPADHYMGYMANELINFKGRAEQYGMSFDFSRYIVNKDIAIGFEVPVLYKRHRLHMDSSLSDAAIEPNGLIGNGAYGPVNKQNLDPAAPPPMYDDKGKANAFIKRYGADPRRFIKDILNAKGIYELGGSAAGIGDVAIFMNCQLNSLRYDKAVFGLRAQFPTGKKASQHKLWGPELGNGGFAEIAGFGSILFSYAKYLNPHLLGQVSFSTPSHVDRRVPRHIVLPQELSGVDPLRSIDVINGELDDLIAFGDRTLRVNDVTDGPLNANGQTARAIDDYDTTIKSFGDKVANVRLTKGTEFKLRIGNMFERFIATRGFMDIFYDFRGKLKDKVSGINTDLYNVEILRENTTELEHRIGLEYSYQYDLTSRLRFGARYTFAGMNVPKTFELVGAINYVF